VNRHVRIDQTRERGEYVRSFAASECHYQPAPQKACGIVACPPGLILRQKQRLLRAAKNQINAELYEVYKTLVLLEQVRRM
jgi:hypothetical protein